jgi:hypothetical protein
MANGPHESVTISCLHRLFALSVFPFSIALVKDWAQIQSRRVATMAKRQKEAGWIKRLRRLFHRFWNE